MAGAGNAADEHVERRQFCGVQRAKIGLHQSRLRMPGLPFVGEVRLDLDARNHLKGDIARQRGRQGAAAREHFQDPEWRRQSAAALDGEGAMRRRDLDAFERRHDLDFGVIRQTGQQRLIREINNGSPPAGHEPAGDVILAKDRGRERQLSGVTADFQRRAGRKAQPA